MKRALCLLALLASAIASASTPPAKFKTLEWWLAHNPAPPASQLATTPPQATTPLKARADGYFWVCDAPGATFDDKLAACYEASDAATPDIIRIRIPWTGASWQMARPVDWHPRHGDQLRVWLIGDDVWRLVEWKGPSGTAANPLPIWRFWGLKESIVQVKGIGYGNYNAWMVQATDEACQSAGQNRFYRCRYQPWDGTVGCIGFWIGYSSFKGGNNDHSATVLDDCSFEFYPSGAQGSNGANGVMDTNLRAGHRAFVWSGYNTTANAMTDCRACNAWGVTTKGFCGQDPGGSSMVVTNFGTSGSPLVCDNNIGFSLSWRGGRNELGGQFWVQGGPDWGNGNAGNVTIEDVQCEDFLPAAAAPFLKTKPESMVSLHDGSNVVMTNVRLWNVGELGQPISPAWLDLWCNDKKMAPVVALTGMTVWNNHGADLAIVPFKPNVREGVFTLLVNGQKATVAVVKASYPSIPRETFARPFGRRTSGT